MANEMAYEAFHCHSVSLSDLLPREIGSDTSRTVTASLRRYGNPFLYDATLPSYQRRVLEKLLACRDGSYGSHGYACDACGDSRMIYTQCNDRHCPGCGWLKRKDWIARVESWELDCSYFHTVFTAPHELSELFNQNRGPSFRLFFQAVQKTL